MIESTIAKAVADEVARILRETMPAGHPDDLVKLPGPLQRRAAMALVRDGRLKASKIGQHWYTTRRRLAALVDDAEQATSAIDTDAIIRAHIQKRNR